MNIVGSPLSRKCSIIWVITNSSKVLIYQAVLLWVPLNQGWEIFPSWACLHVPKIKGKCLNIFLLFHSRLECQNMLFFIIGLFCELDRLNGKKTLKNLFAIFYYYFHWLVGFSIAVLCCTLQLILILIACLNISYARNIRDNSFSGIIPKHWPIY